MGKKNVFIDKLFHFGGRRISIDTNSFNLDPEREAIAVGCYEDASERYEKGLQATSLGWSGVMTKDLDNMQLDELINESNPQPFTLFIGDGSLGSVAVIHDALLRGLKWDGERGQKGGFSAMVEGESEIYLGKVLHNPVGTSGIGTAENGTYTSGVELGAVTADKQLVLAIGVVDPPGVSDSDLNWELTITLESDVDNTFATPTTRLTSEVFVNSGSPGAGEREAPGAEMIVDRPVAGITDTWYRLGWTVSGTSPAFFPMVAAAVLNI